METPSVMLTLATVDPDRLHPRQQPLAEGIIADAGDKAAVRPEPGGRHGLIGALPAGDRREVVPQDGLAGPGDVRGARTTRSMLTLPMTTTRAAEGIGMLVSPGLLSPICQIRVLYYSPQACVDLGRIGR